MEILGDAGIYKITCVETGDTYVGQSRNLAQRWNAHESAWRRGKGNLRLQPLVDKHGVQSMRFEALEYCQRVELNRREIFWIKKLKPSLNVVLIEAESRDEYMKIYMRAKRARQRAEAAIALVDEVIGTEPKEHVKAWLGQLSTVEQMQFKSWVRRCLSGTARRPNWRDY